MNKLHVIIVRRKNGAYEAAYIGSDFAASQDVFDAELKSAKNLEVARYFKPQPTKVKQANAKIKKEINE